MSRFLTLPTSRRPRNENGYTLIETLLVLAIIAFAAAALFGLYTLITRGNDVNTSMQQVQTITTAVQKSYHASGAPYTSLTTQVGIDSGFYPDGMVRGNTVYNPWNGTVTLTGNTNDFDLTYNGVPSEACSQLSSMASSLGRNLVDISVNGNTLARPVDPAAAAAACSQASNTMIWNVR